MKKEIISDQDSRIAKFAKALANPTRVAIVRMLLETGNSCGCGGNCNCGDSCPGESCTCGCQCSTLVNRLPFAQSTISQHIKELKTAGLITNRNRKGNYTLNREAVAAGLDSINKLFNNNNQNTTTMSEKVNTCNCGPDCNCGDNCTCGDNCNCGPDCNCGENCTCGDSCNCGPDCTCGDNCNCTPDNRCTPTCTCG